MPVAQRRLTIVSRKSKLALVQADIVRARLQAYYPDLAIDVIGISTRGDQLLDEPLQKIGGKGLFVNELENYLLEKRADIAVHSMKDVPAGMPEQLGIGAILPRADVRDVFVCNQYTKVVDLPPQSIVGTSSLRRQAQVLAINPKVIVRPLRGNVETRIQKLLAGEYTAIILAAAGLERLGLSDYLRSPIATDEMLPAIGQGALGIQYNLANAAVAQLLQPLNDIKTNLCVSAERALNATLDGGCTAPIAGLATISADNLTLRGLVADVDDNHFLNVTHTGPVTDAIALGRRVALELISKGAHQLIAKSRASLHEKPW